MQSDQRRIAQLSKERHVPLCVRSPYHSELPFVLRFKVSLQWSTDYSFVLSAKWPIYMPAGLLKAMCNTICIYLASKVIGDDTALHMCTSQHMYVEGAESWDVP